jgi:hypothetical protein
MAKKKARTDSPDGWLALVERDLTALGKDGKLPTGHGLDQAANELATLLTRGGKAPLLAGEPGVGKSAIVQELARRIVLGNAPEGLKGVRVLEVPAAGIFARTNTPKGAGAIRRESSHFVAKAGGGARRVPTVARWRRECDWRPCCPGCGTGSGR